MNYKQGQTVFPFLMSFNRDRYLVKNQEFCLIKLKKYPDGSFGALRTLYSSFEQDKVLENKLRYTEYMLRPTNKFFRRLYGIYD